MSLMLLYRPFGWDTHDGTVPEEESDAVKKASVKAHKIQAEISKGGISDEEIRVLQEAFEGAKADVLKALTEADELVLMLLLDDDD